jgi:hypothetical protein
LETFGEMYDTYCSTPPRRTVNPSTTSFQFDNVVNTFSGSLLRFTNRDNNGFNVEQHLQYFFPERDKNTNQERGQMYPSRYCYKYTPRTPLKIVNIKSFTSNNNDIHLPETVHEYFTLNESGEVVRSKASDNLQIDNEFYKFIIKEVAEKIPNVDGVYMPAVSRPAYRTSHSELVAHEELVLSESGLAKLNSERHERRPTLRAIREKKRRSTRHLRNKQLVFVNP